MHRLTEVLIGLMVVTSLTIMLIGAAPPEKCSTETPISFLKVMDRETGKHLETITFPRGASSMAIQLKLQRVYGWDAGKAYRAAVLLTKDSFSSLNEPSDPFGEGGDPYPECRERCYNGRDPDVIPALDCIEGLRPFNCHNCIFCL